MVELLVSRNKIIIDLGDIRQYIKIIKHHFAGLNKSRYKIIKVNLKHSNELLTRIENTWEYVKGLPDGNEEIKIDRMNRMAIEIKYLLAYLDKTLGIIHTLMDIYKEYDVDLSVIEDVRKNERLDYSKKYLGSYFKGVSYGK